MEGARNLLIRNARLVEKDRVKDGDLLIERGIIAGVGRGQRGRPSTGLRVINAHGLYASPGFIDLQVNGSGGYNFMEASYEEIGQILSFHARHGTTALLATTVTAPLEEIRKTIHTVRDAAQKIILGMHIEGPFVSQKQKGAQNPQYLMTPSLEKLDELASGYEEFIRIVTLAPELAGARELIARIKEMGAVPSLGHSDATYEETLKAIGEGVALFTHLFNAMRGLHHREPGVVGAALESDVMVELIADGIHVHPALIRLLVKVKGIDEICLVTDSISAAGLEDGEYRLGGLKVYVREGIARLSDGTLAGSTLFMNRAVRNFIEFTGVSLPEAVRAASLNPATLLGVDERKGSIEEGKDADIVIFDEDLEIHYTIIGGKIVYEK